MPVVKSYAIANGDMYYIRHGSDNFTIIDCCIPEDRLGSILAELKTEAKAKGITRFISTHPDQDHIGGLVDLDTEVPIINFYCVNNKATKESPTEDFLRYVELRDSAKAFYLYKGCQRRWMNKKSDDRGSAGINVLWPVIDDPEFTTALADAADGKSPNNISPIITYSLEGGPKMIWMGDLETDFMEKITDKVKLEKVHVLFAPHHGRDSGKVPKEWLAKLDPDLIVIGEAPSEYLDYYAGYNTITQNSCGDILLDAKTSAVDIFVEDNAYQVQFLEDDDRDILDGLYYLGSIRL